MTGSIWFYDGQRPRCYMDGDDIYDVSGHRAFYVDDGVVHENTGRAVGRLRQNYLLFDGGPAICGIAPD
jgi:hypothetical protein